MEKMEITRIIDTKILILLSVKNISPPLSYMTCIIRYIESPFPRLSIGTVPSSHIAWSKFIFNPCPELPQSSRKSSIIDASIQ